MNIQNVHFQKAECENALIQLNEGLDVFAAVMTMSRLEKANVFSFVVLLIFVICAVSLHTTTPFGARGRSSVRYGTRLGDLKK